MALSIPSLCNISTILRTVGSVETEKRVEIFIAILAKALRREAKDETPWDPARAMGKLALDTTGPLMPESPEKLRRVWPRLGDIDGNP